MASSTVSSLSLESYIELHHALTRGSGSNTVVQMNSLEAAWFRAKDLSQLLTLHGSADGGKKKSDLLDKLCGMQLYGVCPDLSATAAADQQPATQVQQTQTTADAAAAASKPKPAIPPAKQPRITAYMPTVSQPKPPPPQGIEAVCAEDLVSLGWFQAATDVPAELQQPAVLLSRPTAASHAMEQPAVLRDSHLAATLDTPSLGLTAATSAAAAAAFAAATATGQQDQLVGSAGQGCITNTASHVTGAALQVGRPILVAPPPPRQPLPAHQQAGVISSMQASATQHQQPAVFSSSPPPAVVINTAHISLPPTIPHHHHHHHHHQQPYQQQPHQQQPHQPHHTVLQVGPGATHVDASRDCPPPAGPGSLSWLADEIVRFSQEAGVVVVQDQVEGPQLLGHRVGFLLLRPMEHRNAAGLVEGVLAPGIHQAAVIRRLGRSCRPDLCEVDCPDQQRHEWCAVRVLTPLKESTARLELTLDIAPQHRLTNLNQLLALAGQEHKLQDAWGLLRVRPALGTASSSDDEGGEGGRQAGPGQLVVQEGAEGEGVGRVGPRE